MIGAGAAMSAAALDDGRVLVRLDRDVLAGDDRLDLGRRRRRLQRAVLQLDTLVRVGEAGLELYGLVGDDGTLVLNQRVGSLVADTSALRDLAALRRIERRLRLGEDDRGLLLCRERLRAVAERVEIGEDIGTVRVAADAGIAHRRARCPGAGVRQEPVHVLEAPGLSGSAGERLGVAEVRDRRDLPLMHAPEMRADLVGLALPEVVAGRAGAHERLAVLDGGRGQQHGQRRDELGDIGAAFALLRHLDDIAGDLGDVVFEKDAGEDEHAHEQRQRAEKRTQNLVKLKGVHESRARSSVSQNKRRTRSMGAGPERPGAALREPLQSARTLLPLPPATQHV